MFKKINKLFRRKKNKSDVGAIEEQISADESANRQIPETVEAPVAKKGRTVLVFDAKKRVFVAKKRVGSVALYNPDAQTVVFKNMQGEERTLAIPLEKDQQAIPISGFWFDKEECSVGLYVPSLQQFYLLRDNRLKPIHIDARQFKGVGDYDKMRPVSGFWFDSELETIGLYDPSSALFLLKHHDGAARNGSVFQYGPFKNHMQPLIGDWRGAGKDSVGLYDADAGVFFLKKALDSSQEQDLGFHFGPRHSSMHALSGDWNGDGADKIGLYSAEDGLFFLLHSNRGAEQADIHCYFGPAGTRMIPLVADWAGEGRDGIAVYDPETGIAYLKNDCLPGDADALVQFSEHEAKSVPLVVSELV